MGRQLKAQKILDQITELYKELRVHQDKCGHPHLEKVADSNTGNYDPYNDRYWYNCFCPTCKKRWIEDQ